MSDRHMNNCQDLLRQIEAAEQFAHHIGMHDTAKGLNEAKNRCGWELAHALLAKTKEATHE